MAVEFLVDQGVIRGERASSSLVAAGGEVLAIS